MGPRQTAIALDAHAEVATLVLRSGKPLTAGVIRLVQLPTDAERSLDTSFESGSTPWQRQQGSNAVEPAAYIGVLVAFLHRHTEQSDIAIDFFPGRDARAIALDVPVAGEVAVERTIREVAQQLAQALPASAGGRSNIAVTVVDVPPAGIESMDAATAIGAACGDYDAHFVVARGAEACLTALVYNANLISATSAGRLIESYSVMLEDAQRNAETAVNRLALISPAQAHALTVGLDSGTISHPVLPLCKHFESLAQRQPEACAVSHHGEQLSYRELDQRSNRLAHYLIAQGVTTGVPVAVCLTPSVHILVAILAIWKARGVYLPLDPTHPEALIARMVEEARPRLALTLSALSHLTANLPQFHFDAGTEADAAYETEGPAVEPDSGDLAYLFYTSGTTGQPKGVMATQGNLLQYIHSAREKYGFCESDVFCSLARYTFSISLFELISPLACGGSLRILDRDEVLTPERLFAALEEVTVVHAGPSLLGSLFRYIRGLTFSHRGFPRMRHASTGGDIVAPAVMEEMKRVFPNAELFVIYGCTEISCMGTTFAIARDKPVNRSFVGKPFPNVTLRVLDANRNLVPFGVVGEICYAGNGIVRGYLNRPELTNEKFVDIDGQRFYQTGDMGRLYADGNLEMVGRRDFQVKLRGIRIELGGIEKTIIRLGLAAQCAVTSRTVGDEPASLVAFAVKPAFRRIAAFRKALAAELPDYMLPQHLVELDAMPLTVNGKLDRNRLKELPVPLAPSEEQLKEPANERERIVAEVFARVLRRPSVGVDESFFDLGGHSLLGVFLLEEIRKATGVAIAPRVLFESGTVEALAAYTEGGAVGPNRAILLNSRVPGPPLFAVSGVHIYRKLAAHLDGRCSVYSVFIQREIGGLDAASNTQSIDDLVREHLEIIRAQQPKGPYRLLGYSFGGLVAFEIAQKLRAAGEEISMLVLLDTQLEEFRGWRFRFAQLARMPFAPPRDVASFIYHRVRQIFGLESEIIQAQLAYDDVEARPFRERRDEINYRVAGDYVSQMRPYDGKLTLVVSSARLRAEPLKSRTGGWRPFVRQLDLEAVDANHYRMISEEPQVSQVARILKERLGTGRE